MRRVLLTAVVFVWFVACSDDDKKDPLPDWKEGYERMPDTDDVIEYNTDVVQFGRTDELPDDVFALGMDSAVTYPYRLRKRETKDDFCVADAEKPNEVDCVLDLDEWDLYLLGFSFEIVVPKETCDFVLLKSYIFQNWEVGVGPSVVSYELVVPEDVDGGVSALIVNEVNAINGVPYCEYDHRDIEGPNCCVGSYTKTVVNRETGTVTTSKEEWGGRPSDCFDGGAYLLEGAVFADNGWPKDRYYYLYGKQAILSVVYLSIDENRGGGFNIYLADYYDPEDHNDNMPAAVAHPLVRPNYIVECVDDAYEIMARINLHVREWNLESEFDIDGDPDIEGMEPYWENPINDIGDFKDQSTDDETLPHFKVVR